MQKLNCVICDKCRVVLWANGCQPTRDVVIMTKNHTIPTTGDRVFHFCAEHAPKSSDEIKEEDY